MRRFDDFIDSPDIREYNRAHYLAPAEWAVIIGRSMKHNVEEKLEAWEYLLKNYSKEDFECEFVSNNIKKDNAHVLLKAQVQAWHDALNLRGNNENVVFTAWIKELEDIVAESPVFSTYENAYRYISDNYREYFSDGSFSDAPFEARISRKAVDPFINGAGTDLRQDYYFYSGLEMTHIINYAIEGHDFWIEEQNVFIPIPFKKGDIVCVEPAYSRPYYGVVKSVDTPDKMREHDCMNVIVFYLESRTCAHRGVNGMDYDNPNYLDLRYCKRDELCGDDKNLSSQGMCADFRAQFC